MPITALMLAEPPPVQQMPVPQSYQEARQALYVSGSELFEVVQNQPDQTSNAELTTAEVISGIGEGLTLLARNTARVQGQPDRGDVQFSLTLNGELQLVLGEEEYAPDSDVCRAIDRLAHAGFWWIARETLTASSSTQQLISEYNVVRARWSLQRNNQELQAAIEQATVALTGELFELQGGGDLFTTLSVAWRGGESCFNSLRQFVRENR